MTTPKDEKPVYIPATLEDVARGVVAIRKALDKPNDAMRELVEEFRRLAAEAKANIDHWEFQTEHYQAVYRTRYQDFEQAAQMLEERLNGND